MPYQLDVPAEPAPAARPISPPPAAPPIPPPPSSPPPAASIPPPPSSPPPAAPPPPAAQVGYEEKAHLAAIVGDTERIWVQVRRTEFIDGDAGHGIKRGTREIQLGLTVTPGDGPETALRQTFDQLNAAATKFLGEMS
jgi:hypothetical protein